MQPQACDDEEASMMTNVHFPKSGMGIAEGTVVQWHKSVGDRVEKDDVLVEIETAKALQEVLAPVSGILLEIVAPEGTIAEVNTVLAVIDGTHG
jgi:pyruvate/2-oxoglutarate dehydrogenase complex dihydrolipoamide acyltransferase (E2) component